MTSRLAVVGIGLPGWWANIYTAGLRHEVRNARREEIACDVHEQLHDPEERRSPESLAFEIAWAVVRGAPHDLMWRTVQLTPGWWLLELLALTASLGIAGMFLGALPYLAGGAGSPTSALLTGLGLGGVSGLAMAIALRRYQPLDLTTRGQPVPDAPDFEGDSPMNLGFRKWTGICLLISAALMVLTVVFQIGHGINPWDAPEDILPKINDERMFWFANYAAAGAVTLFLLPVFVLLATEAGTGSRQWGLFATGLAAIHVAIGAIAYGSMLLLVPLADEVATASEAQRIAIFEQADTLQDAWRMFTLLAGLPLAIACWVYGTVTFRARTAPRWLGVVAVLLGVGYAPPISGGGENPLAPIMLLVFTVGTAYVLLRRRPTAERASSGAVTAAAPTAS